MDKILIAGTECIVVDEEYNGKKRKVVELTLEVDVEEFNLQDFAEALTTVIEDHRI